MTPRGPELNEEVGKALDEAEKDARLVTTSDLYRVRSQNLETRGLVADLQHKQRLNTFMWLLVGGTFLAHLLMHS